MSTKRLLEKVREFIKESGNEAHLKGITDEILLEIIEECLANRLIEEAKEHRKNSESVIEF
ncbi:hypothetical protein [Pseudotenacibaculum haliotis]|uniref:Uncharacterized protein n=1 Tax=Pseudotenacibaculum haliotis TaxID=1862138 RepID=A0ABW5LP72_9FLAO